MIRNLPVAAIIFSALLSGVAAQSNPMRPDERAAALRDPTHPLWNRPAPHRYRVRIETTKGSFILEATRDLAPYGADRFYHLVETGFYDDSRFFRVIEGRFAQFGIAGDAKLAAIWRDAKMPADQERISNARGSFAFAMVT